MIALDTNILVRLFVHDDAAQSARAERMILRHCSKRDPGLVLLMNLCEAVWVLRDVYRYGKAEICGFLEVLLNMETLRVESGEAALAALEDYRQGTADYADYLMLHRSVELSAGKFHTFDRRLAQHPLAALVE